MCNVCNTGYNVTRSSCRSATCSGSGLYGSLFNGLNTSTNSVATLGGYNSCGTYQTVCRDCNGCLRIQNHSCGCCNHCCNCGCGNGNGTNSGTDSNTSNNGNGSNGNFACLTYCGYVGNGTANTTSFANTGFGYTQRNTCSYARSRSCGCSGYND